MARMGGGSLLMSIVLVAVMVYEARMVQGAGLSPSQCKQEQTLGVNACRDILLGKAPSPACCGRVRVSHVECICPAITPKLASLINVKQAIKLLQDCGRKVPRHFQCGSLNFP
ncbi:uncharacterized protein LOC8259403 [Ricinus communis]|uniref:uncharacterized protein LOC8259403 n=1 Tax=Ricinus communis TaxID=3988 RepID=UPI00201A8561|nr:uncharacterized protein LOC8259403 [Ricinus communis]